MTRTEDEDDEALVAAVVCELGGLVLLDQLVGREYNFFGVADNCFKVGSVVFEVLEDEVDGYRSCLGEVMRVDSGGRPFFATPLARVCLVHESEVYRDHNGRSGQCDSYRLEDTKDGHVWLEFGTVDIDDYYPGFMFVYTPKKGQR